MGLLLLGSAFTSVLRALITNDQPNNYEEVAEDWLVALVVIAVAWALVAFVIKWLIKNRASLPIYKIWGRTKTIVYILAISVLLAITVGIVWQSSLDFTFVEGIPRLLKCGIQWAARYIILDAIVHVCCESRRSF